jgi:ATP-dependent RNA helicase RhlE
MAKKPAQWRPVFITPKEIPVPEFTKLGLSLPLTQALAEAGYKHPTPIQAQAIPPIVEGRDLLGIAQTGTGKTAAFALPILEELHRRPAKLVPGRTRVLVLTPTRELAAQIEASFKTYGKHTRVNTAVIFGGVGQDRQVRALRRGLDVLIATPGRLLDLMQQRHAHMDHVGIFVLDEADRMLDMGFIRDIRKIVATLPAQRQTLLFSATMPTEIAALVAEQLKDPVRVEVTPQATTVERIDQKLLFVDKARKRDLLRHCLTDLNIFQALVFTRTKRGADKVAEDLEKHGVQSAAIHGNKAQNHRERTLRAFRGGQLRVLVATDIAARGLDIPGVSHVFNYELPDEPESYVHRIGRTARAGRGGQALAFCCNEELENLRDIERTIGMTLEVDTEQPYHAPIQRLQPRGQGSSGPARRQRPSTGSGQGPRQSGYPSKGRGGHEHHSRHQRDAGSRDGRQASRGDAGLRPDYGERRSSRPEAPAGVGGRVQERGPGGRADRPRHEGRPPRGRGRGGRNSGSGPGAGNDNKGGGSAVGGFFKAIKKSFKSW